MHCGVLHFYQIFAASIPLESAEQPDAVAFPLFAKITMLLFGCGVHFTNAI